MPGLIANTLNSGRSVYGADTSEFDPELRDVDASTETTAGQLHQLLSSGSPYLERARTGARETANQRGLLNSSLAAGAGEAAAIDAALPIASSDASTYTTRSRDNQGFTNTARQFNAGAKNTSNLQAADSANMLERADQAGEIETGLTNLRGNIQSRQIGETGTQQRLTQSAGGDIERGLTSLRGDIQSRQIGESGAQQRATQAAGGAIETGLIGSRAAAESGLLAQKAQISQNLLTAEGEQKAALLAQQADIDRQIQELRGEQTMGLQTLQGEQAQQLQTLRGNQAAVLEDIQTQNAQLLQANQVASQLFSQVSNMIDQVLKNPEIPVESKQQIIQQETNLLQNGLVLMGGIANLDLAGLLDFTPAPPMQTPAPAATPPAPEEDEEPAPGDAGTEN